MANSVDLIFDEPAIDRAADRLIRRYLTAGTTAVGRGARHFEQQLERDTRAAAGGNLWRAWSSKAYPKSGPARNPAAEIFGNGGQRTQGALQYWTQPGRASKGGGGSFAIPLPAAGATPRGGRAGKQYMITPEDWMRRTGLRLRLEQRPGKAPVLMAYAPKGSRRKVPDGPIFVIIPDFSFRNAVSVQRRGAEAQQQMVSEFLRETQRIG